MALELIKSSAINFDINEKIITETGNIIQNYKIKDEEKLEIDGVSKIVSIHGFVGTTYKTINLMDLKRLSDVDYVIELVRVSSVSFSSVKQLLIINLSNTGILTISKPGTGFLEVAAKISGKYTKNLFEYIPAREVNINQNILRFSSSEENNYFKIYIVGM